MIETSFCKAVHSIPNALADKNCMRHPALQVPLEGPTRFGALSSEIEANSCTRIARLGST
jgi:hypothetical protein